MKINTLCIPILCASLAFPAQSLAAAGQGSGFSLSKEIQAGGSGNEYISGNFPGAVLMPVNLWGPVGKPGIHHIPTRTDLITLLSLAGGPTTDAELDSIFIKRRSGAKEDVIRVDAEEFLQQPGSISPVLEANDIIIIPRSKPTINPNTAATIGFISSLISLALAGIALSAAVSK